MSLPVRLTTLSCILFTLLPTSASATVRINEIAWMGTTESHLCNWIELYNTGDQSVDVIDWSFEINDTVRALADGTGPSSVVAPSGYLLLKRETATCPDPVPAVSGWSIVMGNLPNSGATLRLRRSDGSLADEVIGGTDWSNVGGDNDTKQTAQLTPNGWITADPTPGIQNTDTDSTVSAPDSDTDDTSVSRRVRSARAPSPQSLTLPDTKLKLEIIAPEYGYVNQPLTVTASTSGVGDTIDASLQYHWNWGDLSEQNAGAEAVHTYQFPGTYIITAYASYARHEQVARHEVTILPTPLTIEVENGLVHIHNAAPYEIDVSRMTISGLHDKHFPKRSFIPAHGTITVSEAKLGIPARRPLLAYDRTGAIVASSEQSVAVAGIAVSADEVNEESTATTQSTAPTQTGATTGTDDNFRFSSPESTDTATSDISTNQAATTTHATRSDSNPNPSSDTSDQSANSNEAAVPAGVWWPPLALLLLLVVAAGALLAPRRLSAGKVDE